MKKAKIQSLKEINEVESLKEKSLFFKFLKSLSSQATIVVLKFTPPELQSLLAHESLKVSSVENFNQIFDSPSKEFKKDEKSYVLKKAILLETRLSKRIPNFDYNEMKNDATIIEFQRYVNKRLGFEVEFIKQTK